MGKTYTDARNGGQDIFWEGWKKGEDENWKGDNEMFLMDKAEMYQHGEKGVWLGKGRSSGIAKFHFLGEKEGKRM